MLFPTPSSPMSDNKFLRYGIAAGEALSLSATARQMGITRDTARGLERRANASIRRLSTRFMDHLEA